jgi:VanZ family protein
LPNQPWRNPRPAPPVAEVQPRLSNLPTVRLLRAWWPALLWSAVIFTASTDSFSAEHTGSIVEPILRWFYPAITQSQFGLIHHLIRKTAHLTEYFVYGLCLYRGLRRGRQGWRLSWGLTSILLAAIYASLDEFHQSFVPSRTASPYDSLLDTIGASIAILVLYLYFRLRRTRIAERANP